MAKPPTTTTTPSSPPPPPPPKTPSAASLKHAQAPFSSPSTLPPLPDTPSTTMHAAVPRSSVTRPSVKRSTRSTRSNAPQPQTAMSTPTPKSRSATAKSQEPDVIDEEAEEVEAHLEDVDEEEEVEDKEEEQDVNGDDDGEDTVMSLPSPQSGVPKTPYKNVDTRVNDRSIFSSGGAALKAAHHDDEDDHEMSDPLEDEEEDEDVKEVEQEHEDGNLDEDLPEAEENGDEQEDEHMHDDKTNTNNNDDEKEDEEEEDDNDFSEEDPADYRRGSRGGKVRNFRESGATMSTLADRRSSVHSEDEEEEEEEIEVSEPESEGEGGVETTMISLNTPTRPTRAVPRRLLASSVANSSPGRTPLARRFLGGGVTATPANGIPQLDFTTPAMAASAAAFTGLRTPFLHHGTPASLARPGAVSHFQLAIQNEMLAEQMKAMEAENKYLRGIAQGAGVVGITDDAEEDILPQTYSETVDEAGLAAMEAFVEYGTPDKKRVKWDGPTPSVSRMGEGEETVRKRRAEETERSLQMMNTPTAIKARRESLAKIRSSPVKAFAGLFENITAGMATPPSVAKTASESLFGTPGRVSIAQPVFEVKSAKQRKEDKRRRMTREFREFSAINMDLLKGWLPTTEEGEEEEEEEEGGQAESKGKGVQEETKTEPMQDIAEEDEKDRDGDHGMAGAGKTASEPAAAGAPAASPHKAATTATPEPRDHEGFSLPAEIPQRKVTILPYVREISRHRRSNSAPAVPNAPSAAAAAGADDEEDADITISPLAQEMITSLQQRIALLQHELDTSNAALAKATAQLVGEMRARRVAEEVKEYMELEKSFGVCCQNAVNRAKQEQEAAAAAAAKAPETRASKYAGASLPQSAHVAGVNPVAPTTAGKKRTRDEREQSAPLPPPAQRVVQKSMMAEKRSFTGTSQQPTRPTRTRPAGASALAGMTAPQAAAKKPTKTALGTSTHSNAPPHHPPISTGMEKPAIRGAPTRPKSRLAERDDEPVGRRTRAGSIALDGSRPLSRFGDRPTRQAAAPRDEGGLDVYGRLAGGGRSRR
ncbi:hypothetical protein DFH27DRAFT_521888 [Peziza echinospora]|nr:hypothetical protein DFH27DRAFT_521888 [Peziza echinospora]